MKVLAINSSARKDGNTAILIETVFQELNKEGIDIFHEIFEKMAAAVAAARRGGAPQAIDAKNHFFLSHEIFVAGSVYWNMGYGRLSGDVLQDQEGLDNMKNLGQNMAFLMKTLEKKTLEK